MNTVLIVDDEVGPRESLRMILKPIYEVYTVGDGHEALRCIHDKNIDLVTLDLIWNRPNSKYWCFLGGTRK